MQNASVPEFSLSPFSKLRDGVLRLHVLYEKVQEVLDNVFMGVTSKAVASGVVMVKTTERSSDVGLFSGLRRPVLRYLTVFVVILSLLLIEAVLVASAAFLVLLKLALCVAGACFTIAVLDFCCCLPWDFGCFYEISCYCVLFDCGFLLLLLARFVFTVACLARLSVVTVSTAFPLHDDDFRFRLFLGFFHYLLSVFLVLYDVTNGCSQCCLLLMLICFMDLVTFVSVLFLHFLSFLFVFVFSLVRFFCCFSLIVCSFIILVGL